MKNLLYILILFLVLPLTGLAQNDSIAIKTKEQPSFNNQIDLDVQFLGIDFLYKHRIAKKLFLGGGFGGGAIVSFSNKGMVFEILESKIILDYHLSDRIHFYGGLKFLPLVFSDGEEFGVNVFGFEAGLFFMTKRIEFGAKLSLIDSKTIYNRTRAILAIVPLVVKIPLGRW